MAGLKPKETEDNLTAATIAIKTAIDLNESWIGLHTRGCNYGWSPIL